MRQVNKILNLARAGSYKYALSEYTRLGFDKVRYDEDIMALHGRLYKDLFFSQKGKGASEAARLSVEKYEAAFEDTQGFYSGINAATMSLLAGFPEKMVQMRAQRILDVLPPTKELDSETKYFIEATRAEALLLLCKISDAQKAMQVAFDHDPLNYTAHASTLKQFRMIAAHRKKNLDWLREFQPPIAVHFAGHMFGFSENEDTELHSLSRSEVKALEVEISETIQVQDIGFGYGALAAGSDILIAEALLEGGGELHVTLPVARDIFVEESVRPFGEAWIERFETCVSRANSFLIVDPDPSQSSSYLESQASLSSMGAAIRRAESLSVPSGQMLIWDAKSGVNGTAADAALWAKTGRPTYVITCRRSRVQEIKAIASQPSKTGFVFGNSESNKTEIFNDIPAVIALACKNRTEKDPQLKQVLDVQRGDGFNCVPQLMKQALPGSIILSENVANHIAIYFFDDYAANWVGRLDTGENIYALRLKG